MNKLKSEQSHIPQQKKKRQIPHRKANHKQQRSPSPELLFDEIIDTRTNIPMTSLETETFKSKVDLEQKRGLCTTPKNNLNSNLITNQTSNPVTSQYPQSTDRPSYPLLQHLNSPMGMSDKSNKESDKGLVRPSFQSKFVMQTQFFKSNTAQATPRGRLGFDN